MTIFFETLALLSDLPGSLVYHLIVLFTLEAGAALALSQWWQWRSGPLARLALGASLLLVVRLVLLAAAVGAALGVLDPLATVPPLDRLTSTLTVLIALWIMVFPLPQRIADAVVAGLGVFALIAYVVSLWVWVGEIDANVVFYNGRLQETAWEIAQMLLLLGGAGLVGARRPSDWGWVLAVVGLLLGGHIVHYLQPLAQANVPGAVRLVELLALPILVAIIYRRAHADFAPVGDEPAAEEPVASTVPRPKKRRAAALDAQAAVALASLNVVTEPDEFGQVVALAISRTFRADICLFATAPDPSGYATVTAGYDLIREQFLPSIALPLEQLPTTSHAIRFGAVERLTPEDHPDDVYWLSNLLELDRNGGNTGPVMVAPILNTEVQLVGCLFLLSPYVQHRWSPDDQRLLEVLIEPLAATLSSANRFAEFKQLVETQQKSLAQLEAEKQKLVETADQTQAELNFARTEIDGLLNGLREAQDTAEQQRREAEKMAKDIQAQREAEVRNTLASEINDLRSKLMVVQNTTATNEELEESLRATQDQLEQAQADWVARENELMDEISILRAQLAVAQAHGYTPEQATLDETQSALDGTKDELIAQTRLVTAISADLAEKEVLLAHARSRVQGLEAQIANLESKLTEDVANRPMPAREMIASLSQEMRQPISTIYGYAELLLGESIGLLGASQKKFVERIKTSAERVVTSLDDLMRVTALETGAVDVRPQDIDVVTLLDEVVLTYSTECREKGISVQLDLEEHLPTAQVDPEALRQILLHLLKNALAASAIDGEVTLTARREAARRETEHKNGQSNLGDCLYIAVRDSGGGIAPADQPRVFSRLYQAEASAIAGLGERGVGLSIAKALTEAHGGKIWITSEIGKGSTFAILLPLKKKDAAIPAAL